jgi:hypothetical protein
MVSNVYSENLKLKEVLRISDINIQSYDSSNTIAVIEFKIDAIENFTGTLKIGAPNSILDNGLQSKTQEIQLAKQKSKTVTIAITLPGGDISLVDLSISIPLVPKGYVKRYYRYFKLLKSEGNLSILDPRKKSQFKSKKVGKEINFTIGAQNNKAHKGIGAVSIAQSMSHSVSISGRILISGTEKGLYGNCVELWFRNSGYPADWYHPIIQWTRHVKYDILDEQGNFSFAFSFSDDISYYDQVIVIVSTANDAAYLPRPEDGHIYVGLDGYSDFFNESEGVIAYIDGNSSSIVVNQNGYINQEDGMLLRYMQVAREFTIQRYGGSCPFNLPRVECFIEELLPYSAGLFVIEYLRIVIDPLCVEATTTTHEYGHYVNCCMWGQEKLIDASRDLVEGWAIFY